MGVVWYLEDKKYHYMKIDQERKRVGQVLAGEEDVDEILMGRASRTQTPEEKFTGVFESGKMAVRPINPQ